MPHIRDIATIAAAPFQERHWRALRNAFSEYREPVTALYLYLKRPANAFPRQIHLRTPTGPLSLQLHHMDDILTVNEVFCRLDYSAGPEDKVVVDFGSNIGISAAYFLTRSPDSFCYLFEPNPRNVERLNAQLDRFHGRFALNPIGVAPADGELEFGFEPTGRYGGAGLNFPDKRRVPVRAADAILQDIIVARGHIDLLKVDIESLELEVLQSLSPQTLRGIRRIYLEHQVRENVLAATHDFVREGCVARFDLRGA